jgi:hypothetical protein
MGSLAGFTAQLKALILTYFSALKVLDFGEVYVGPGDVLLSLNPETEIGEQVAFENGQWVIDPSLQQFVYSGGEWLPVSPVSVIGEGLSTSGQPSIGVPMPIQQSTTLSPSGTNSLWIIAILAVGWYLYEEE